MLKWELVNATCAGIEEYKHHQRLRRRGSYFTEDNLKILLFLINTVTVIRGFYSSS